MSRLADAFKAFVGNPPREATFGGYATSVNVGESVSRYLVDGLSAGDLYATQPHLRTVVSFVSRNVAQLGRHIYRPDADGGRERVRDSAAARLAKTPNEYMTSYEIFDSLVHELSLHDFAVWKPRMKPDGDWAVDPIPGDWVVNAKPSDAFRVGSYAIKFPDEPQARSLPASELVVFRGYNAEGPRKMGSSPVRALRGTLSEQLSALEFREQMWKRGGRVGSYLTRPKDAPAWSPEARERFIQNWRNSWSGSGSNAGATPLLEDGLELKRVGFSANQEQFIETATLALTTVAGAYHVPPTMVGAATGSTFSSTREFRKMLYTETLGPIIAQIEDTWNTFLLPYIGADPDEYMELNIQEKLQGDFSEQAQQLQSAIGAPYMTRNEGRRMQNLPAVDGGDELIIPLNVLVGGQASPNDTGSQNDLGLDSEGTTSGASAGHARAVKAPETTGLEGDLAEFFAVQRRAIVARLGQKDVSWFDQKRWDSELSATLYPHLLTITAGTARAAAKRKGVNAGDYSVARTEKFLKAVSDSRASAVNAATVKHFQNALDDGVDIDGVLADTGSHAKATAGTLKTFAVAWATKEVAQQLAPAGTQPTKTWIASGAPISRHVDMDGETVKLSEPFSNGADFPGDPVLGGEGVANCGCSLEIDW